MDTKRCPRCGEIKPVDQFYQRTNGKPQAYCKPCHAVKTQEWNAAHPYLKQWYKDDYKANPEKYHARMRNWRARKQGLPDAAARVGPCDICGIVARRVWDHDHETGLARGWLCSNCNTAIGLLGDTAESVEKAVAYLRRKVDSEGPSVGE